MDLSDYDAVDDELGELEDPFCDDDAAIAWDWAVALDQDLP